MIYLFCENELNDVWKTADEDHISSPCEKVTDGRRNRCCDFVHSVCPARIGTETETTVACDCNKMSWTTQHIHTVLLQHCATVAERERERVAFVSFCCVNKYEHLIDKSSCVLFFITLVGRTSSLTWAHTYTCTHTPTRIYTHICLHTHRHTPTHTHTHINTHKHTHTCPHESAALILDPLSWVVCPVSAVWWIVAFITILLSNQEHHSCAQTP